MSETNYSIDHDLSEAKAFADHLVPYVYEGELYGSIGGMFGSASMPRLTVGGLLLRLSRLHALQDQMTAEQKAQLAGIDAQTENARREWSVHYHDKLVQEATSRLKMIEQFFGDCADDPRTCAANYPPEAMRRTIVQVILDALDEPNTDLDREARKVDTQLHRFTQPGEFIWASALQPAYPQDSYWWLYAKPPRAGAG